MVEKKAKPASTKVATAKSGSAVVTKPKTTKVSAPTPAKKPALGKTASVPDDAKTAKTTATVTANKTAAKKSVTAAATPAPAKAPAVRKVAAPAAASKVPAGKAATAKPAASAAKRKVAKPSPQERHHMVQTAAYFIAERNGFSGHPDTHWADAELEIDDRLGK